MTALIQSLSLWYSLQICRHMSRIKYLFINWVQGPYCKWQAQSLQDIIKKKKLVSITYSTDGKYKVGKTRQSLFKPLFTTLCSLLSLVCFRMLSLVQFDHHYYSNFQMSFPHRSAFKDWLVVVCFDNRDPCFRNFDSTVSIYFRTS